MPNGFNRQQPIPPVRGALSAQPDMFLPQQAPAIAPGMPSGPAPMPPPSANPLMQGAGPSSPPAPSAPGAMPPQAPQMPMGGPPQMGGPMPPQAAGTPPAGPAGPSSMLSSANSLIGRVLKLMQPPQQAPQQPPMGGMPRPGGGQDPRAQIMQMLAMSGQPGGPAARAQRGGPQQDWEILDDLVYRPRPGQPPIEAERMPYRPRPGQPPIEIENMPYRPGEMISPDRQRMIEELLGRSGPRMPMRRGGYPMDYLPNMPGLPVRSPYARGDYVAPDGMGDGRSDHVPAKLSPGEFVMDAETVSMLGNGDNDAGARRLDQMRQNIRKQKGKALAQGKFSPNAKEPESYLPKKPKGRS